MVRETIEMPLEEYEELLRANERIAIINRMMKKSRYVAFEDMLIILNIDEEESENEAV